MNFTSVFRLFTHLINSQKKISSLIRIPQPDTSAVSTKNTFF